MPNIGLHRFKKNFTGRLSNKLFLIWLLMTPPYLKYITTVLCNLSLITALVSCLQCFDAVGWGAGRASGL